MPFFDAGSQILGLDGRGECESLAAEPHERVASAICAPRLGAPDRFDPHHPSSSAADPPFHASWDTRPRVHFDATLVRVTTDTGLEGYGSGDQMVGFAGHEPLFVGQDALAL